MIRLLLFLLVLFLLVLRVAIIYLLNLFVELSTEEGHRIKCTYSRAQVCFDTPRIFLSLYKVLLVSGAVNSFIFFTSKISS